MDLLFITQKIVREIVLITQKEIVVILHLIQKNIYVVLMILDGVLIILIIPILIMGRVEIYTKFQTGEVVMVI